MNELFIYYGNKEVGQLIFHPNEDVLELRYSPEWQLNGFPLSPHLPLRGAIPHINIKRFIENLFPEGTHFERLLEEYRLSRTYTLRILSLMGAETTGAFRFSPTKDSQPATSFREVPIKELSKRLDERSQTGLVMWDEKPRLSVTGVQDKLPLLIMPDGKMGFGDGDFASNTIVKFQNLNNKTPHLVLNEYFCMTLARKVGLATPEISFRKIGTHPALFIQRFDREWNKNSITRKHIIDGCQATNLPASYKYERNLGSSRDVTEVRDGVSFQKIFDFNRNSIVPAKTAIDILNWTILNLCIGNSDAHGKNISYYIDKAGIQLAPLYDLVNIAVYPELEQDLAMSVGDEFDARQVKGFQLLTFGEQIGIDKKLMGRQFKTITEKILSSIDSIQIPAEAMDADFVDVLKKSIKTRTKHFQLCAQEALKIKA